MQEHPLHTPDPGDQPLAQIDGTTLPPAAQQKRGGGVAGAFSWAVITLLGALLVWINLAPKVLPPPAPVPGEPVAGPEQRPSVELMLVGRLALNGVARELTAEQFLKDLDKTAENPLDTIRAAILAGAIEGRDHDANGEPVPSPRVLAMLDRAAEDLNANPPYSEMGLTADIATLALIERDGVDAVPAQAQTDLQSRHGWFGDVALLRDLPESSPQIRALRTRGDLALAALGLTGLMAVGSLLAGLVLLPLGIIRLTRRPHQVGVAAQRFNGRPSVLIEAVAWFMALFVLVQFLGSYVAGGDLMWLLVWIPAMALFWPLLRGVTWRDLRGALGWHHGRGLFTEIGAGVTGYVAGTPIIAVGMLLTILATMLTGMKASHPIGEQPLSSGWQIAQLYLLAVVWAPLVEESVFRGAMLCHLRRRMGLVLSALFTGFVFGIIHPQGLTGFFAPMSIGIVFALVREWRGSLIASITGHALNNAVVVTMLVALLAE